MSRSFVRTSFQYLYYAGVPLTDGPLTISAWVWRGVNASSAYILALGDATGNTCHFRVPSGTYPLELGIWGSGGSRFATTSTGLTQDVWSHVLGSSTAGGQSMRALINNGGLGTASGFDLSVALTNNFNIARNPSGTHWEGRIAEIVIWNAVLDAAEETALYRKVHPFHIRPQNLVSYIPLWREEDKDYVWGVSFTPNSSPTVAEHPSIIHQLPRTYFLPPSGTAVSSNKSAYIKGRQSASSSKSAFIYAAPFALRPDGDISGGTWQNEAGGASLYPSIDEIIPADSDYAWHEDAQVGDYFEVSLTNPGGLISGEGHYIRWRAEDFREAKTITVKCELRQGTSTVIASDEQTLTGTPQTFEKQLSSGEIANITDYDDLRLRFTVTAISHAVSSSKHAYIKGHVTSSKSAYISGTS